MLTLAFEILPVKASGTIYIRADGSVDPLTAPIQQNGNVYTLTGNINEPIVVQRSHIVIDGNGYMVKGPGSPYPEPSWKWVGFTLFDISNVTIKNTKITEFVEGVYINYGAARHTVVNNTITNNDLGIYVNSAWNNTIDSNTIANNRRYGIILIWCYDVPGNMIVNNIVVNNALVGINLGDNSKNTTIRSNTIANNNFGIYVDNAFGNTIYHSNFVNNSIQVDIQGEVNSWDNGSPSGGNFWSDYNGTDLNGDGIGDTPYEIDANNQDRYPLIVPLVWNYSTPIPIVWEGTIYPVSLNSNSTISTFKFNQPQKQISFNLTGLSGTIGYCNVTIPKSLLTDNPWTITINDVPKTDYTKTENDTHTSLYFTYTHASTQNVKIIGTTVIPEFPTAIILPLLITLTILAVVFTKKRFPRKPES
jgi:parallel beta-helix repeat protein